MTRRWALASGLATVLVATACGTTVSSSEIPQAGQAGFSDLAVGGAPGAQSGNGSTSGGPGSLTGLASTGSGAAAAATGSTATGVAAGAANGTAGPSGTSTKAGAALGPIKIGALTAQGAGHYQQSLGFKGATGDQIAMTQSVVDYINAHGGLGGRNIRLVSYDMDPASAAADESSAAQAACTYFTQDHKVAAIVSLLALMPENFYQCLANGHVPLVTPDEGVSHEFLQRYANTFYMPGGPSYTRLLADSVDALWKAGWLTPKSTVGLVGYDTTDVHAIVDRGLVPALQRHGLKLTATLYTSTGTDSPSEYGGGVLSFRTKHVDRIFFAPGGEPVYFALAAEQQAYHPRYELGSLEYPTLLAANLPADQLVGSMGLGWLPYWDLPSGAWPTVTTPGVAECRKAMAKANQNLSSGTDLGVATWICDDWMFLRDVFDTGATPDEVGIRQAVESLGAAFQPASTFRTTLTASRTHDGASSYRLVAFDDACQCYKYVSPVRPLA